MPSSIDPPLRDDELECGHCGTHFYYELTRCPNCGVNIYEPEDESDPASDRSSGQYNLAARIDGFIRRFTRKPYPVEELFGASIDQAELFENLRMKVGGDRDQVERLVEFERHQHPQGNRLSWLTSAIQRWERDNRVSGSGSD
jgi:hypothetical protein